MPSRFFENTVNLGGDWWNYHKTMIHTLSQVFCDMRLNENKHHKGKRMLDLVSSLCLHKMIWSFLSMPCRKRMSWNEKKKKSQNSYFIELTEVQSKLLIQSYLLPWWEKPASHGLPSQSNAKPSTSDLIRVLVKFCWVKCLLC